MVVLLNKVGDRSTDEMDDAALLDTIRNLTQSEEPGTWNRVIESEAQKEVDRLQEPSRQSGLPRFNFAWDDASHNAAGVQVISLGVLSLTYSHFLSTGVCFASLTWQ